MLVRINETQAIKELAVAETYGADWTIELLGDDITYNEVTSEYEMYEAAYGWWNDFITDHNSDAKEIRELAEQLGISESDLVQRLHEDRADSDLAICHMLTQIALEEIREAYGISK